MICGLLRQAASPAVAVVKAMASSSIASTDVVGTAAVLCRRCRRPGLVVGESVRVPSAGTVIGGSGLFGTGRFGTGRFGTVFSVHGPFGTVFSVHERFATRAFRDTGVSVQRRISATALSCLRCLRGVRSTQFLPIYYRCSKFCVILGEQLVMRFCPKKKKKLG